MAAIVAAGRLQLKMPRPDAYATAVTTTTAAQPKPLNLPEEFKTGSLRLSQSMFGSGVKGTAELKQMYDEKKWEELIPAITSKKFVVNTYYFYLGAAAEELGFTEAASVYYDLAMTIPQTCAGYQTFTDTCVGFKFPDDALKRKSALAGAMKGTTQTWALEQSPTVADLTGLTPSQIQDLPKRKANTSTSRGKFETEEEYQTRINATPKGFLVVTAIDTNNSRNCLTAYEHMTGEYKVSKCLALAENTAIFKKRFEGDSVRLSNMLDSRDIKRMITESYYLKASFAWNQVIKLTREEAQKLDGDLMVGAVVSDFEIESSCSECESRTRREATAALMKSAAALSNRPVDTSSVDWKREAFLAGSIAEDWTYLIKPTKIQSFIIFRRSDSKVVFKFSPD
jgi:hypothetical protein